MWTMQKQIQPFPPTGDSNSPLIAFEISRCKFLHQPVNLLGLPRESKALQEHPQRRHKVFALKVHLIHVGIHHLFIETVIISEEFSYLSLREQNTEASLINILQCNNTFKTRKILLKDLNTVKFVLARVLIVNKRDIVKKQLVCLVF